ncbi:diacylglycerol/lipid kinase family protein [Enterococcus columbae]|uniref:DAGKc domain-containing protein n=1 Tax=Enterococcus columbae DSM 7374 = ATCC 51263 TaxID=1121865 RepID=S1NKI2_9ENTE|nr:diacylglycerol kinase family protein [Enterococcus columbae]EOT41756.1 hypothetical protein OMW_01245 [Enterococcus columbae DSM 7374 = ATCC 51263]EOW80686.1 hypothetical protein I568_01864 [Enterococcus columbae DSM 7374 = ATCC 51263]OJG21934.1 hypothetical protein RR47_GL001138 [Enterococcus columbae DSM 7374 = ATCC 51263]
MEIFYHVLINPNSGGGNGRIVGEKIIDYLSEHQLAFDVRFTGYPDHERQFIRELAQTTLREYQPEDQSNQPYPLLLIIGGDGTIHQVVNELYRLKKQFPIAYIPAGSGNDFARALNLPKDPVAIIEHIHQNTQPTFCHILHYDEAIYGEEGLALNNVGIGLDAAIVYETNHSKVKDILQKFNLLSFSYLSAVIQTLVKQRSFPILVEANGQTYNFKKAYLCTTSNHPYFGGGIPIAPKASVFQNKLDLIIIEKPSMLLVPWIAFKIFTRKHLEAKFCHYIQANKIKIVSTIAQHGQADGEELGERSYDITFDLIEQPFWF